ncbi:MAG: IS66 family transposase, partial [Planctomycetes bacterium]|nr:IS66 family transposase [Planctomycetota bacterium]
ELDWKSFSRRLVDVYRDTKKLHGQTARLDSNGYDMSVARLEGRSLEISRFPLHHLDGQHLVKRIEKYENQLSMFQWYYDVPMDNKTAECSICPTVPIRKKSYSNQSGRRALLHSVLMTVFRTLKLQRHYPLNRLLNALAEYSRTSSIPPLPAKTLQRAE